MARSPFAMSLVLNAGRLQDQLSTELSEEQAEQVTASAAQLDSVLQDNPATGALLAVHIIPALAALYGHALLLVKAAIARGDEREKRIASRTLALAETVFQLSQLELLPTSAGEEASAPGASGGDEVEAMLRQAGIIQ